MTDPEELARARARARAARRRRHRRAPRRGLGHSSSTASSSSRSPGRDTGTEPRTARAARTPRRSRRCSRTAWTRSRPPAERARCAGEAVRNGLRELGRGAGPVDALDVRARRVPSVAKAGRCLKAGLRAIIAQVRFLRMKPGHGEVLLAEGDVEVADDERELIEEFRRQLDQGMWAAVPTSDGVGPPRGADRQALHGRPARRGPGDLLPPGRRGTGPLARARGPRPRRHRDRRRGAAVGDPRPPPGGSARAPPGPSRERPVRRRLRPRP